jgi:Domain of unknown function (DUF6532)
MFVLSIFHLFWSMSQFGQVANEYERVHNRYTSAIRRHISPRVNGGMYGTPAELRGLLQDDRIFTLPPITVNTCLCLIMILSLITCQNRALLPFGSKLIFDIMCMIFLGTKGFSIGHHYHHFWGPKPLVPFPTVALAATYVRVSICHCRQPQLTGILQAVYCVNVCCSGPHPFNEEQYGATYNKVMNILLSFDQDSEVLHQYLVVEDWWLQCAS